MSRSGTIRFSPPDAWPQDKPAWGFAVFSTFHDLPPWQGSTIIRFFSPDFEQAVGFAKQEVERVKLTGKEWGCVYVTQTSLALRPFTAERLVFKWMADVIVAPERLDKVEWDDPEPGDR